MSSSAASAPASYATNPARASGAGTALGIGLAAIAITIVGFFISPRNCVTAGWLVGIAYWTAIALGFLLLTMILHIFDANWGIVLRRQLEHGLTAFRWLALLFLPLLLLSFFVQRDIVWGWLSPNHLVLPEGKLVSNDVIYAKKAGFLNAHALVIFSALFFVIWLWLSARLRKASFSQDIDRDPKWTLKNRFTAGMGIPLTGLTLTFAAIYWFMSLEYHWFSTMFGVWYFADCMRGALNCGVLIMFWLWQRGDYQGVLNKNHWYSIGMLMLAFTVFWGYIAFSQYFLIWNANVPEETFWFNEREFGGWFWVGMFLVFGHFLTPFLLLLSYRFKVTAHILRRIACWILGTIFIDLCWNILPAVKDAQGHALPFFSWSVLWALTSTIGIGGVCVWSYLREVSSTKLIPIHDPRIGESLTHHDDE
jgi:hypothetical protein